MNYPNYLIHFNKNHSKANGQFVSGDGDGDGVIDDHAHRSSGNNEKKKWSKKRIAGAVAGGAMTTAFVAIGAIAIGKEIADRNRRKRLHEATVNGIFSGKSFADKNSNRLLLPEKATVNKGDYGTGIFEGRRHLGAGIYGPKER